MPDKQLAAALGAVDWDANVAAFLAEKSRAKALANANLRIAIWSAQFEHADIGNTALPFVREMQLSSLELAALVALGLYQSAANAMRGIVEAGLYYTYFRSHPDELATLVREPKFFLSKQDIIDFHKLHTVHFKETQSALGVIARLEEWYRKVSSIIHRQVPGAWATHTALKDIKYVEKVSKDVVATFLEGEDILHHIFLCTVGKTLWSNFAPAAKKELLKGLSGAAKAALKLDGA